MVDIIICILTLITWVLGYLLVGGFIDGILGLNLDELVLLWPVILVLMVVDKLLEFARYIGSRTGECVHDAFDQLNNLHNKENNNA